jgi:hypothetical protein
MIKILTAFWVPAAATAFRTTTSSQQQAEKDDCTDTHSESFGHMLVASSVSSF